MKISPNDTIRKVIIKNGTLFGIGNKRIYESIVALPKPEYVKEKRRIFGWKKHDSSISSLSLVCTCMSFSSFSKTSLIFIFIYSLQFRGIIDMISK